MIIRGRTSALIQSSTFTFTEQMIALVQHPSAFPFQFVCVWRFWFFNIVKTRRNIAGFRNTRRNINKRCNKNKVPSIKQIALTTPLLFVPVSASAVRAGDGWRLSGNIPAMCRSDAPISGCKRLARECLRGICGLRRNFQHGKKLKAWNSRKGS